MREYIDIFNRIVDKLSNAYVGRRILFTFHHLDSYSIRNDQTSISIHIDKHDMLSGGRMNTTQIFHQLAVFRGSTPQITDRAAVETFWQQALAELGFRGILHIDAINTFRENEQEIQNRSRETGQDTNGSNSDTNIQGIQGRPESWTVDGGRV